MLRLEPKSGQLANFHIARNSEVAATSYKANFALLDHCSMSDATE